MRKCMGSAGTLRDRGVVQRQVAAGPHVRMLTSQGVHRCSEERSMGACSLNRVLVLQAEAPMAHGSRVIPPVLCMLALGPGLACSVACWP